MASQAGHVMGEEPAGSEPAEQYVTFSEVDVEHLAPSGSTVTCMKTFSPERSRESNDLL